MAISPNSEIILLKAPLYLDNKNQLTFKNKTEQFNYFNSLPKVSIDNASYQRKDNVIRYPAHIDEILEYNYCMYQNENYTNKWFYCFINNMEYVNDGMTNISITTDVFQTWQFDLNFKQCFVEREMINVEDDIPGANLIPENLETGEYVVGGKAEFDDLEPINVVAYSGENVPSIPSGAGAIPIEQGGFSVNGIATTIAYIIADTDEHYNILMNALQASDFSNFVIACFTVPKLAVSSFMTEENAYPSSTAVGLYLLKNKTNYFQPATNKTLISTPTSIDGYTPRNQKLRTYPYLYVGFAPKSGTSKIYRYEDFANGIPKFKIISEVNPNPTIYMIPENYRKDIGDSLGDIASFNGYPSLASKTDTFNIWTAQNSQTIGLQMEQAEFNYNFGQVQSLIGGGTSAIGNIATGNYLGAVSSGINTGLDLYKNTKNYEYYVKNQMAQIERQKMLPDNVTLGGSNATLLGYGLFDKNIFIRYNIKKQFAERIDLYFDMYGYYTNKLKVPNLNNRPNWNYIKTINCIIESSIPQNDLDIIKNMFDNGITLWHNPQTFMDYSQDNR